MENFITLGYSRAVYVQETKSLVGDRSHISTLPLLPLAFLAQLKALDEKTCKISGVWD